MLAAPETSDRLADLRDFQLQVRHGGLAGGHCHRLLQRLEALSRDSELVGAFRKVTQPKLAVTVRLNRSRIGVALYDNLSARNRSMLRIVYDTLQGPGARGRYYRQSAT